MEEWLSLPWWQQEMYLDEMQGDPQVRRDCSEEEGEGSGDAGPTSPSAAWAPTPASSDAGRAPGEMSVGAMQQLGIQARQVPAAG